MVDVDLLERLSEYMAACHDALRAVTARLDEAERTLLHTRFPDWCESWYRQHFPKGEIDPAQLELFEQYKRLSRKVDRGSLLAVAQQHPSVCEVECRALQEVLPGADVTRTAWRLEGDSVCTYTITWPEEPAAPD